MEICSMTPVDLEHDAFEFECDLSSLSLSLNVGSNQVCGQDVENRVNPSSSRHNDIGAAQNVVLQNTAVIALPAVPAVHPLRSRWNMYYHLANDKNWTLSGYKVVMGGIDTLEKLIATNQAVSERMVKYCMLFVMREGVTPLWEDKYNRAGGCFSYKVPNKVVFRLWNDLMYLMCGNTLMVNPDHMRLVNGITVSPKRNFCIVKVWLADCSLQDPSVIVHVPNLSHSGCLFKAHFGDG